jgi:hypothetical protein
MGHTPKDQDWYRKFNVWKLGGAGEKFNSLLELMLQDWKELVGVVLHGHGLKSVLCFERVAKVPGPGRIRRRQFC